MQQFVSSIPQAFYEVLAYYTSAVYMLLGIALLFVNKTHVIAFLQGRIGDEPYEPWLVLLLLVFVFYAYSQVAHMLAWLVVHVWVVGQFAQGFDSVHTDTTGRVTLEESAAGEVGFMSHTLGGWCSRFRERLGVESVKCDVLCRFFVPIVAATLLTTCCCGASKTGWCLLLLPAALPLVAASAGYPLGAFIGCIASSGSRNRDFLLWKHCGKLMDKYPEFTKLKPCSDPTSLLLHGIRTKEPALADTLIKELARCDLAMLNAFNSLTLAVLVLCFGPAGCSVLAQTLPWPRCGWAVALITLFIVFCIEYYFRKSRTNHHLIEEYVIASDAPCGGAASEC